MNPTLGPDATGAGWVYEYLLVDHNHRYSLADLRSLQDWYLRYQIATVPGVAEVASIGGFVRQYQVRLNPDKLRAYNIALSTVIDRVRDSTNEVGGRLIELGGAEYMIRGLGYLRSLSDLETVPVTTKNGTPVLVRDLGSVVRTGYPPRRGGMEWRRRDGWRHRRDAIRNECSKRDLRRQAEAGSDFRIASARSGGRGGI